MRLHPDRFWLRSHGRQCRKRVAVAVARIGLRPSQNDPMADPATEPAPREAIVSDVAHVSAIHDALDEVHAVYRQNQTSSAPYVIDIDEACFEFKAHVGNGLSGGVARKIVKAGGLFCSHGAEMTFVVCKERRSHFRHVKRNSGEDDGRVVASEKQRDGAVCCPCSTDHLEAQVALRDHDYTKTPVLFKVYRECKIHSDVVFSAGPDVRVALEVRELDAGKRLFVTDVAYTSAGSQRTLHRVEVLRTHKASTTNRENRPFLEVRAEHVLYELHMPRVPGSGVVLRCERIGSTAAPPCVPCAQAAAKRAARAERLARARAAAEAEAEDERVCREFELHYKFNISYETEAAEEEAKARAEAEAKAKAEARAKAEADARAKAEADAKAKAEADAKAKAEAEAKARAESDARAKAEADARAKAGAKEMAYNTKRMEAAASMMVVPKPTCVTIGTAMPEISQEEIDRRRKERMQRQAAQLPVKKKRRKQLG